MSTAGKVLTILVLLVMAGWIVLLSAVTQLNVNHAKKINEQAKVLDQAIADAEKAVGDFHRITHQARAEQDTTDRDVRVLMDRIASAQNRASSTTEDLTRLKFQLADYLAAVEKAQTNLATREAEKAKGIDDLAKKRDEIAKSQAANAELRAELAQLQDEFKRLLAENTGELNKIRDKAPATKPASSRRDPAPL